MATAREAMLPGHQTGQFTRRLQDPLDPAPRLSARLGNRILLKREDLQPVFSFKLRGACNRLAQLTAAERAAQVQTIGQPHRVRLDTQTHINTMYL